MPRPRRVHMPGGLYHAVLRGNHRRAIFSGNDDYLCFEDIVSRALVGNVASRYARAKQRDLATTGHLFERRYRARLIDADRYLLVLVRYVHLIPVRARTNSR